MAASSAAASPAAAPASGPQRADAAAWMAVAAGTVGSFMATLDISIAVSYTHLTLPTIYSV